MARLALWPAVGATSVLVTWLINGVMFPSTVVPARQVAWIAVFFAVVGFAVAWSQRKRS